MEFLIGIAGSIILFGLLLIWFLSAVARYWFPYKTRWYTFHKSKDWFKKYRKKAFQKNQNKCPWCNTTKRLQGHFRDYRYMGRGRCVKDVFPFCAKDHARLPRSKELEKINNAEKGIFSQRSLIKIYKRCSFRCCGCGTHFDLTLRSRDPKSKKWYDWYLICSQCVSRVGKKVDN